MDNNQGSLNGTHFGGIKQCKYMELFRDFPPDGALFGVVTTYDPLQNQTQGGGGWKYQSLDYRVLITVKSSLYKSSKLFIPNDLMQEP